MKRIRSFFGCAALLVALMSPPFALVASAQTVSGSDAVEIVAMTGGTTFQGSIAFDATGRFAALVAGSGAELWDIKKGRLVRTFADPGIGNGGAVALSTDASRIAAGGTGKDIIVWETTTGRATATLDSQIGTLKTLAFSKDGRRLVYGGQAKVDVFQRRPAMVIREIDTGRIVTTINSTSHFLAEVVTAHSPARDLIAVGDSTGTIRLLDIDGRLLRTWNGHKAGIHALAFSPDGTQLASSEWRSLVKIWEVSTTRPLRTLADHDGKYGVDALSWSPDGNSLATVDAHKLRIWDAATGTLVKAKLRFKDEHVSLSTAAYAPDGASLFADGISRVLDAKSLELRSKIGVSPSATFVLPQGISGSEIVVAETIPGSGGLSLLWLDLVTGSTRSLLSDPGLKWGNFMASKEAAQIAVGGEKALFSVDPARTPPAKILQENIEGYRLGAISSDGRTLALLKTNSARLVDTRSGATIREVPLANFVHEVALSPDGQTLAFVHHQVVPVPRDGRGATLRLLSVATGREFMQAKLEPWTNPNKVVFAPDGRSLLVAGTSGFAHSVDHWSAQSPRLLGRLRFPGEHERNKAEKRLGPTSYVAAFHADGKTAVIGDHTVLRLWELEHPRVMRTYRGHTSNLDEVTFAAGGERIVSRASDGLKVWNAATGDLLVTYLTAGQGERVVITPEGFFDATEGGAKMLSVVHGREVYSIDQVYQSLYRPDLVREKLAGDPSGKVRQAAARLDLTSVLASGGAPRVAIAAPATRTKADTDEVAVEATIADQGGGIGRVEWRVNGVTLGLEERGLARAEGGAAPAQTLRRALSLEPGDNRIEVVAYNGRNLIASDPARITVSWDGERSVTPPKLHVLAVGVNDYWDSRLKLAYAVPDAKALGAALAKAGAGLYGEGGVKVTTVADEEVTIANLDKAFAGLGREVHPRDTFALFVAGHGKTLNGRYYFLPRDFRYEGEASIEKAGIDQDRLQAWLAQIKARKTVLLIDTCESGSLTGDRLAVRGLERVAAFEKLTRAMGRTVLSASSDDAPALEGYRGHGAFTYVLLEALGAGDVNNNGLIEVGELADYLEDKLPELTFKAFKLRQVPHRKMVGNNFVLAGRAAVLPAVAISPIAVAQPAPNAAAKTATHVVTQPTAVRAEAGGTAAVVIELSPGMQVTLVETSGGWALVARDGKRLGYVEQKALAHLQ